MSYSDINRVVLVARLTRDPELRALQSGSALCSLRVACNRSTKEPDGSYRPRPGFFNVMVFGSAAENVARYLHKGSRVAVDGRLQWGEWQAPDGTRRQAVDVVAERVEFLDSAPSHPSPDGAYGPDWTTGDPNDGSGALDPGEEPGREPVGVGAGAEEELAF